MTQVHDRHIDDPMAWRADEIGGKAGLSRRLGPEHLQAFDRLLAASTTHADLAARAVADPVFADLVQGLRHDLNAGRGCVVLTGLDPARYGQGGYRRLYALVGGQLGVPVAQSERGDTLGYVRQEADNQFARGYISNIELRFHSDFHEMLSLASVQKADRGGESSFVSGLTLHNILRQRRPEVLPALYEGYFDALMPYYKLPQGAAGLSDEKLPVFSQADGRVSIVLADHYYAIAAQSRGEEVPTELEVAVRALREVAEEPGVAARFDLEPGEMAFWRNWVVLHGRTRFENGPDRRRELMRLWMHAHESRPAAPPVRNRALKVDKIHAVIAAGAAA